MNTEPQPLEGIILTPEAPDGLVSLTTAKPLDLFTTPGIVDGLLVSIRAEALRDFTPDLTSDKGRKAIASRAYRVAKTKAFLDTLGKEEVARLKELPRQVDAGRKTLRDGLDTLANEIRKPLTDWEARVDGIKARLTDLQNLPARLMNATAAIIGQALTDLQQVDPASFDEFAQEAHGIKTTTLATLQELLEKRELWEADQAELQRLREEKEAREKAEREEALRREGEERARKAAEAAAARTLEGHPAHINAAAVMAAAPQNAADQQTPPPAPAPAQPTSRPLTPAEEDLEHRRARNREALADLAEAHRFREVFLNDPDIGGRYSALSCFGLAPAALLGVDIGLLLERAAAAAAEERPAGRGEGELPDGLYLGAVMGSLARAGRDKLTLVFSPALAAFGDWLEQLIAESTGKEGRGIVPVVGEPPGAPDVYGDDRVFVHLCIEGEGGEEEPLERLARAGQPVLRICLRDRYDLGGQIFLWETATAAAGHLLGINPFDQPDVEAAKVLARGIISRYVEQGRLPPEAPAISAEGIDVYGDVKAQGPGDALNAFLDHARPGSYVALQAYLEPRPGTDEALANLRCRLRDRRHLVTTAG